MAKKSKSRPFRLAVSTCGGDCPGLNAAIAATVRHAARLGYETIGVRDGLSGFIEGDTDVIPLSPESVRGISILGGTILGTSNKGSPFRDPAKKKIALQSIGKTWNAIGIDAMLTIGGDGSHWMMKELVGIGLRIVGIPKTIDNDLNGSELTIGFSTAVNTATAAAMSLRNSADSHSRIMILEVMGRDSGHIALSSGMAADADCILLPEIPFDLGAVIRHLRSRSSGGRDSYVIVAAEGATPAGMDQFYKKATSGTPGSQGSMVLGGIGQYVADHLHDQTGKDARATVLGHIQRGGMPDPSDRILAARFATYGVDLIAAGEFGQIVGIKGNKLHHFPYGKMKPIRYMVPANSDLIRTAEASGICLGR
jgi:6-phosphofructokinase 1